jgi:dienelactone hydrolase
VAEQSAASAAKKRKRWLWAIVIVTLCGAVGFAAFALFASVRAFDVRALSEEHPAFDDASGRRPAQPTGCALTEVETPQGCTKAKVSGTREESVVIPSSIPEKHLPELHGTLTVPLGLEGKRRPAVILLHGSGPTDRDGTARGDLVSRHGPVAVLRELAQLFAREGIIALRWDKRHCPKCYPAFPWGDKAVLEELRWADLLTDARDALALLAKRPDVDPSALVVVGHSEGGILAPNVAFGRMDVAAVIMLAPLFSPLEDQSIAQLRRARDLRRKQWDIIGSAKLAALAEAQ